MFEPLKFDCIMINVWLHLIDFPLFFNKGNNFCDFLFGFLHTDNLLNVGLVKHYICRYLFIDFAGKEDFI